MKRDSHLYDTSDYKPNNLYGNKQLNKKVIGLMKDEMSEAIMTDFIGLQ